MNYIIVIVIPQAIESLIRHEFIENSLEVRKKTWETHFRYEKKLFLKHVFKDNLQRLRQETKSAILNSILQK
jgi:hypothetical protein